MEKSFKIIDSFCTEVGSDRWPTSWNGAIPTQEQKEAFYARVREGQAQATGAGSSSTAYTSAAEDSAEEDSATEELGEEDSEEEDSDSDSSDRCW
eukprot:1860947-Prymnesium_polylepis.1